MKKHYPIFLLVVSAMLALSCRVSYQAHSLQYQDYRISQTQPGNPAVLDMIRPYSDSVNKSMNDIIGIAATTLDKKSPEGTLGNFMADAYYSMAAEKFKMPVDVALMNFGGIRLTQLAAGNITRGKIFELMPFDNLLIIQRLKGSELQQLLDLVAARGGWPVAGMTMQIRDRKAVNVRVGGQPLDPGKIYTVANSDFVANGGDNADMLRSIPQQNIGYLMRDALFDYIKKLQSEGKPVSATIENRVTHAQ